MHELYLSFAGELCKESAVLRTNLLYLAFVDLSVRPLLNYHHHMIGGFLLRVAAMMWLLRPIGIESYFA